MVSRCPAGPRGGGTVVKDLRGYTLLPGLIDAHVHLTADGSPDLASQMLNDTQGIAALKMATMHAALFGQASRPCATSAAVPTSTSRSGTP